MITWDETMSVGIWKMDRQHKKWIEIINALSECIAQKRSCDCLNKTFSNVCEYTRTHFSDEEALLAKNYYADLNTHREGHADFIRKLDILKKQFESQPLPMAMDLMNELCDWLIHHIKGYDKQYGQALSIKNPGV